MAEASVTIPLSNGLLEWLKGQSARNERSLSGEVRFHLMEAMRRAPSAALEPWPPPLPVVTRENLSDVKEKVRGMEAERDALAKREHLTGIGCLYPHEQDRLSFLRGQIETLQSHVRAIERLSGVAA